MKTISQVAKLAGISIRTLQYYDEIGLLKPTNFTQSGYRLYNDEALQRLQQILFFKELGFRLKEISEILQKPDFDRLAAFRKQKELLLLKRNRMDWRIFTKETTSSSDLGERFWDMIIESYTNDLIKAVNDEKYGSGASEYIAEAFRYYFRNQRA